MENILKEKRLFAFKSSGILIMYLGVFFLKTIMH